MKSVFKQLAVVAVVAVSAIAQETLRIETPLNAVVCRPLLINWSGGEPPYFLSVRPGGQPAGAPAVLDFGTIESGNTFRWTVNLEPNTQIGLDLRDSTGLVAQSADFSVLPGPDTSCVGQDPSTSAGSSSSASGSSSGSVSTPASTSPPVSTTASTPATSGSPSASVSPPAASSSPSATPDEDDSSATSNYVPAALVGLAGAAAVLLA